MKKLLVLSMAFALFAACNNNKPANNLNTNNREKDDYRNNPNTNNDNNNNDRNKDNTDNNRDRNNPGGWSKADEASWMNACNTPALADKMGEEKASTYCSCVLEKLKTEFSSMEEVNTKGTQQIGLDLGKACMKELGFGADQ
jgi:hypothetical protein